MNSKASYEIYNTSFKFNHLRPLYPDDFKTQKKIIP